MNTIYDDNCSYLYNKSTKELFISLSFEDLTNLDECVDYFVVDVYSYESDYDDDPIQNLVDICKSMDAQDERYETIRRTYGSEVDESTGQEIVGGNICIEDVDIL